MTAIQFILLSILGLLFFTTCMAFARSWASRRTLSVWAVLWLIGMAAVIWPDSTTRVAELLGIRRGADLLLYCTSVVMLFGFFVLYIRLRRIRRDLTILTRQIAIRDAHENDDSKMTGEQPEQTL